MCQSEEICIVRFCREYYSVLPGLQLVGRHIRFGLRMRLKRRAAKRRGLRFRRRISATVRYVGLEQILKHDANDGANTNSYSDRPHSSAATDSWGKLSALSHSGDADDDLAEVSKSAHP
jgi:hypothetical protein